MALSRASDSHKLYHPCIALAYLSSFLRSPLFSSRDFSSLHSISYLFTQPLLVRAGEEIVSGAQRIHDVSLLTERAEHWKVITYTSICILNIHAAHTVMCPTSSGHAHVHMHVHKHMCTRHTYTSLALCLLSALLD